MSRSVGRSSAGWFLAWFGVGALDALAMVGALTIGIFVLPVGIAATVFLATRRDASDGIGGLISGLGLPVLYIAYLNRDGPGTICRTYPGGGSSCVEEWSPWPWFAIGMALVLVGVAVFTRAQRSRSASDSQASTLRGQ